MFELDRFEWAAPDRLEVEGRWSQLRARRFVRPTLTLRGESGTHRLLALLEHKPWAPDDNEPWIAAFAWSGEPAGFESAELAVASEIEVELPPPTEKGERPKPRKKAPAFRAVSRDVLAERQPVQLEKERAHALDMMRERDAAIAAREAAERERDEAARELEELRAAASGEADAEDRLASARAELEDARDSATADRIAATAERDSATAERDSAIAERDAARAERDALAADLDAARAELDLAQRERDALVAERDAVVRERDAAMRERDAANRERAHPPIRPLSPLRPAETKASWAAVWTPRLVALGIFALLLLTLLVLFGVAG